MVEWQGKDWFVRSSGRDVDGLDLSHQTKLIQCATCDSRDLHAVYKL